MTSVRSYRGCLFAVVGIGLALLAGALISEVGLRIYAKTSESPLAAKLRADPLAVLIEGHGEYGYRQKPDRTFRFPNGTSATSNAQGFRGPLPSHEKSPETLRVILIGGSTTHGWGVNDGETIDAYLGAELARRHPNRKFEVFNLGFDGYDSYQIFERLKTDGLPLHPDFIIVNTTVNDVRNARIPDLRDVDPRSMIWLSETTRSKAEKERGGPTLWTRVKHYSFLARVPALLRSGRRGNATMPADTTRMPYPEARDYFQRNLWRIVDLVGPTSATLLFSTEPSSLLTKHRPTDVSSISYWVRNAATTQEYRDSLTMRMRTVADSASSLGMRVAYIPYQTLDPSLFIDDAHLTAEGNQRMAEVFADALQPYIARK